jgi:hypothetical protein
LPWKLTNSHLRRALRVIVVPLLFVSLFHLPVTAQVTAAATHPPATAYQPISGNERIRWAVKATVGPQSLAAGVWSAGWGTAMNTPPEYGTHWGGFAKRYGMPLTGVSTGNAIEASLGMLWNEDPRYFQSPDRKFMGHNNYVESRKRKFRGECSDPNLCGFCRKVRLQPV